MRVNLILFSLLYLAEPALAKESMSIPGNLIIAEGLSVVALDLSSGEKRVIEDNPYRLPFGGGGTTVSALDADAIVLDSPSTTVGDSVIRELYWKTGQARVLGAGAGPIYLRERKKLVYSRFEKVPTYGYRLYLADYADIGGSGKRISDTSYYAAPHLLKISESEIIIPSAAQGLSSAIYNIDTGAAAPLTDGACIPAIWRSETKEILCVSKRDKTAYLEDLAGGRSETIELKKGAIPVTYIASIDSLIASVPRLSLRGEAYDLYAYSFRSRAWMKILNNCVIGLGAAVWVE